MPESGHRCGRELREAASVTLGVRLGFGSRLGLAFNLGFRAPAYNGPPGLLLTYLAMEAACRLPPTASRQPPCPEASRKSKPWTVCTRARFTARAQKEGESDRTRGGCCAVTTAEVACQLRA